MEYDNVDPYNQHLQPPSVTEDLICGSNNVTITEQGIITIKLCELTPCMHTIVLISYTSYL